MLYTGLANNYHGKLDTSDYSLKPVVWAETHMTTIFVSGMYALKHRLINFTYWLLFNYDKTVR